MDAALRAQVTSHFDSTVDIVLERVREKARLFFNSEIVSSGNGTAAPFSKILFPQIKLASLVERSFSASIGTSFNYIARDLVRNAYGNGEIEKVVEGEIPANVVATIDALVDNYRGANHASPDTPAELAAIRTAFASPSREMVTRRIKSDVFFEDHAGIENYVEIKTPMPNYDTCKAVKTRILLIHALRHPTVIEARVAFPHNPNGSRGVYSWPPTRYFLDANHDWAVDGVPLMGEGFWNYLGDDPHTFANILACCQDVFERRNGDVDQVLKAVAFGTEEI